MDAIKVIRSAVPTFEPVTLDDVKSHLRIARGNEDHHDDLKRLIQVARELFEKDTDYVLSTGTYVAKLDDWPCCDYITMPVRPVSAITSITYTDSAGTVQTWSSSNYSLNVYESLPEIVLAYASSWPSNRGWENDITITLVAGYASQSVVPFALKQALLQKIQHLFDGDDPRGNIEKSYERIVQRFARSSYP